jgi:DNA repair protein RecN (Recombination protein N)
MLAHLAIHDLALVDRLELDLGPGLNVLTGETGTGKSVLIGALSLVLGARSSPAMVRRGAEEARVEALFELRAAPELWSRLESAGIDAPDEQLLVTRTVRRQGRGRVTLNGRLATVSMLSELLRGAVDLTSQHEHMTLLAPEAHLDLLDAFAGNEALAERVEAAHGRLQAAREELAALEADDRARARRQDYLRFAIDEIAALDPSPQELEELAEERRRLRHADELAAGLGAAEAALYSGEGAVVEVLGRLARQLDRLAELDAELEPARSGVLGLVAEVEELSRVLSRRARGLEAEPERLAQVEERIAALEGLLRKYGDDLNAVLEAREGMREELEGIEGASARRAALEAEAAALHEELEQLAGELTRARETASERLAEAVQRELADLALPEAQVRVELTARSAVGPRGAESAELLLAANRGEPARPLRRSASGGELSRVLLAVKQVLSGRTGVCTHVFDEVDTGVGGATAERLGAKLARAAESAQVLAVTHLPQVAAFADVHFRVYKAHRDERTVTGVERLAAKPAVEELARMLGGVEITERTRALARELRGRAGADARAAGEDGERAPRPEKRGARRAGRDARRELAS